MMVLSTPLLAMPDGTRNIQAKHQPPTPSLLTYSQPQPPRWGRIDHEITTKPGTRHSLELHGTAKAKPNAP